MSDLFRDEAIKNLRSPEQLDTVLRLTSPIGWLSLAVLFVIIAIVTIWGVVGSVPVQVKGMGVFLDRGGVVYSVIAPAAGRIDAIDVKVGQVVTKGTRLAVLSLPNREAQLRDARRTMESLQGQYDRQLIFSVRDVESRNANMRDTIGALNAKITADKNHLDFLQPLYDAQQEELEKGYITRKQLEQTRSDIFATKQSIRDSRNKIAEARSAQVEFENQQRRTMAELEQQVITAKNSFEEAKTFLETEKEIFSPVDGRVTEIDVKLGVLVKTDDQVAVIEKSGKNLELITYFEIGKGKKIHPGMRAEVAPSSIERDLYGSIRGNVESVSDLPETQAGLMAILGNETLVGKMMGAGAPIKVVIALDKDPKTFSGLKWSSSKGPPLKVTTGDTGFASVTVREERPINLVIPIFETWITGG
ncbi:MAG TPA: NHLP bacteriocin system secretion protein [Rhodospirillaceae bacterium]|jgi:HlyD family secretion protein|nr:NHLP bacteriocin system secretion protein [Rhodospirillaceae bacterium]MDP6485444.1 NHLP bacteriocin system secretion protein [Alphaproteobacteria bacterium]MDP6781136.1 NHLP bacteriocin system secretion protein [Alphaproteobacteria bacterium]HAQ33229.1 NHLP bacteriocin system secretion protein [Rhodospirillaceae bacterium]|tara:strand:- start:14935 stop:16188 length:1254 start_codon:yes stop_codon:yes gene_type:complete